MMENKGKIPHRRIQAIYVDIFPSGRGSLIPFLNSFPCEYWLDLSTFEEQNIERR
jgi:hypothetical protein